ncbi:MAG: hypothetical protein KDA89_23900 [Planctomycetaceae bacterium]|nr:hypothetical protein [Planctomycetaceae bacterium]
MEPSQNGNSRGWSVVWWFWIVLIVGLPWPLLETSLLDHWDQADLRAAFPFAAAGGTLLLHWFSAARSSNRLRCLAVVGWMTAIVVPCLCWEGLYRWAVVQALMLLMRVFVAGLWIATGLTLVLIGLTIRSGRLRWRPWVPSALKCGLSSLLLLTALECAAVLLQPPPTADITFPENLLPADDDSFHIAAVGGSTMKGFPYDGWFGPTEVAALQLRHQFPECRIVLENLAETGLDLQLALKELNQLKHKPDVIVVYSGHNEFFHSLESLGVLRRATWKRADQWLAYSPLFRLLHERTALFFVSSIDVVFPQGLCGNKLAPDFVLKDRLDRYRLRLERLFRWAQRNTIRVVFCVPAADEADFCPNVSVASSDHPALAAELTDQWTGLLSLQAAGRHSEALEKCRDLLAREPQLAEFHFQAGRCQRSLGEPGAARNHFREAVNLDQLPIRATEDYRNAGRSAAAQFGIPVVDSETILRDNSPDGLLSKHHFLDGVHPKLQAAYLIGNGIAEAVISTGCPEDARDAVIGELLTFDECLKKQNITAEVLAAAYGKIALVLEQYSKLCSHHRSGRTEDAARFHQLAADLKTGRIRPGENGTESLPDEPLVHPHEKP